MSNRHSYERLHLLLDSVYLPSFLCSLNASICFRLSLYGIQHSFLTPVAFSVLLQGGDAILFILLYFVHIYIYIYAGSYGIILYAIGNMFTFHYLFFFFRLYVILHTFLNPLCYFLTPVLIRPHLSFKFSQLLFSVSSLSPHFLRPLPFILFCLFLRGGHAKL
jgi:hypothetical protein